MSRHACGEASGTGIDPTRLAGGQRDQRIHPYNAGTPQRETSRGLLLFYPVLHTLFLQENKNTNNYKDALLLHLIPTYNCEPNVVR